MKGSPPPLLDCTSHDLEEALTPESKNELLTRYIDGRITVWNFMVSFEMTRISWQILGDW